MPPSNAPKAGLLPRAQDDLSTVSLSEIRQFRDYQADRMSAVSATLSVKMVRIAFKSAIRERLVAENAAAKEFIDPRKQAARRLFRLQRRYYDSSPKSYPSMTRRLA